MFDYNEDWGMSVMGVKKATEIPKRTKEETLAAIERMKEMAGFIKPKRNRKERRRK